VNGLALLASVGWVDSVGRSLREGFFMFWETLWPLVMGFGLSGAVQAFVSHESLQRVMGDRIWCSLVVLLVRGHGHEQVSFRQRGRFRVDLGLHVRVDESGH
jgi:hypothetical protein